MFHIEFDRQHKVAWARFSGQLSHRDIGNFDSATAAFLAAEGCQHFVLDFTAIESVAIPDRALADRAKRPHMCPGFQRVVVAPQIEIAELYRLFAAYQSRVGSAAPRIVKTMEQALVHLGVGKPEFRHVRQPPNLEVIQLQNHRSAASSP
jgi:hypothetical protein